MKDLDFDELDQAVSSVLGTNTDDSKPADAPAVPVSPKPASISPTPEAPKSEESVAVSVSTPSTTTPAVSPAVRRRGQFLDMVHPTSKMTSQTPTVPPAARKKLAPVSLDVAPQADLAETKPTPAPVEPEAKTEDVPAKPETVWPDPLDVMSDAKPEEDTPKSPDDTEKLPVAAPEVSSTTTPFVTDAKVDKRPLDAFAAGEEPAVEAKMAEETKQPETSGDSDVAKLEPSKDESPSKPSFVDTTPPELQPDVVSVESDAGNELADSSSNEAPEVPTTPAVSTDSGMAQSIPQQYKTPAEKPEHDTPHPIFDTHEYHQPLLPATSKKSRSWLIVVIILLLLVVGAALGYFAFMAGL